MGKVFLGWSAPQCNNTAWPIRKLASRPGALPGGLDLDCEASSLPSRGSSNSFFFSGFTSRLKTTLPATVSKYITACYLRTVVLSSVDIDIVADSHM